MDNRDIIKSLENYSNLSDDKIYELRNSLNVNSLGFTSKREGMVMSEEDKEYAKLTLHEKISGYSNRQIKQNLTTINFSNGNNLSRIKYIVVHYTANNGDTAYGNTNYFKSTYRGVSAHYFVDENPVIWQCVLDKNIAWHCGSENGIYYSPCRNSSSIGIELCSRQYSDGVYYFKKETIDNAIWLIKKLMREYNIPIENVIRHYDVTHKICPEPFVSSKMLWDEFKDSLLEEDIDMEMLKELENKVASLNDRVTELEKGIHKNEFIYSWIDDNMPEWARDAVRWCVDNGIIQGDGDGLALNDIKLWVCVVLYRFAKLLGKA